MFEWGTVLSKNPEKRKFLLEIFPDNPLYNIQVLSCTILKESPRHGETDLVAEVRVNACTTQSVYKFIEEFQDSSFANLNLLESGDRERNGQRTKVNISRKCHHNVDGRYLSQKRKEGVSERERVQGERRDGKRGITGGGVLLDSRGLGRVDSAGLGGVKAQSDGCRLWEVSRAAQHARLIAWRIAR